MMLPRSLINKQPNKMMGNRFWVKKNPAPRVRCPQACPGSPLAVPLGFWNDLFQTNSHKLLTYTCMYYAKSANLKKHLYLFSMIMIRMKRQDLLFNNYDYGISIIDKIDEPSAFLRCYDFLGMMYE